VFVVRFVLHEESTGKTMSRQRISALCNSVRIQPDTIAMLAKALGVKADELTKPVAKDVQGGRRH
jgi:hypothetical protein